MHFWQHLWKENSANILVLENILQELGECLLKEFLSPKWYANICYIILVQSRREEGDT